jgi:hypothetical protein
VVVDITPASIDQVQSDRKGGVRVITADVGDVAKQLRELDRSLVLRYHEHTDHYSVVQMTGDPDSPEHLVTTCQPVAGGVDPRLVGRIRKVIHPSYDVVGELERHNDGVRRDQEREVEEHVGDALEHAAHDFRRMTGNRTVFVPRGVRPT